MLSFSAFVGQAHAIAAGSCWPEPNNLKSRDGMLKVWIKRLMHAQLPVLKAAKLMEISGPAAAQGNVEQASCPVGVGPRAGKEQGL